MGVATLLTRLAPIRQEVKMFRICQGSVIGVDAFVWLHQFAVNHFDSLVAVREPDYKPVVKAFLERAREYLLRGMTPFFVFDGRRPPGKDQENEARLRRKLVASQLIADVLADLSDEDREAVLDGSADIDIDDRTLKAAVAVDDGMVTAVICALRETGLGHMKAPYEADHQLAALDFQNVIQYVETADSDLIVHGCRRVLTKVNAETGGAHLFLADDITRPVPATHPTVDAPLLRLTRKYGTRALLWFAVLAGCDYLKMRGFGPMTALTILGYIAKHPGVGGVAAGISTTQIYAATTKLSAKAGERVPDPGNRVEFIANITDAMMAYTAEYVYDPVSKSDQPLCVVRGEPNAIPPPFCGTAATGTVVVTVRCSARVNGQRWRAEQSDDDDDDYADPELDSDDEDGAESNRRGGYLRQLTLLRAEAHSLGFLESRASGRQGTIRETQVTLPDVGRAVRAGRTAERQHA